MATQLVQKEVKAVYMWVYQALDYTKMQGPCASGYHVPTGTEAASLQTTLRTLGITTTNVDCLKTYLKFPCAGYRHGANSNVTAQGTDCWTWCSTAMGTTYVEVTHATSTTYAPNGGYYTNFGFNIRPFKNTPTVPTSSWTTLYDGSSVAAGAGIFHNASSGLISVSSDGQTWITIMDKNLGATTVYNDGDTLSQANCGNYYQRGNNYGFPFSGTVSKSSTLVDVSNYGPGNYYSSSTFINSSNPYSWMITLNGDLRGGVTGAGGLIEKQLRPSAQPVSKSFSYTGSDQTWTVPYTQDYTITCKGAGSNTSAGGLGQGTIHLTAGTILKIMVGQNGASTSSGTYGFGGTSNYSSNRSGGGLSGVFTGSAAITATSSARALVIGGGAGGGQSSSRAGGAGGGETGANGGGSNYGTAGGGGTQTGRNSGGNVGANQFNGGNGSGTYGRGGGGGRYGGNGSIGDGSGDDDKGAGGGSGYVISTASNRVLTQGGGSAAGNHGSVTIVSVNQ